MSRCFRIVVPRQIVDIVTLTVAEWTPPIGRYIGYQSTIQTVDAESSRSEILSHEGKQTTIFAQKFCPGFEFPIRSQDSLFSDLSRDRYFRKLTIKYFL